ncbi:cellulose binding domain-containing protein [Micromonospora yasonensis]|uniref:cellulose binding domain-containing protein n=1 Tax=Micromonospora yasonensis TaxID=1128667 RepID=UPI00223262E8|nr:cellulose binding domain-containing protein [Micromonospora yasonensis]MCW3844492.1 cellulose binding domain-containing protein [Micromonospora yasonensis]
MSIGQERPSEAPSGLRMLASVPWIVVLLGVGLLTTLLLVAVFSVREKEHESVPAALDPPIYLPTVGVDAGTSAPPTVAPLVPGADEPSPTGTTPGRTPSSRTTSAAPAAAPAASALVAPATPQAGTVTARYEATRSDRDWFEARLTVTNGSGRSQSWEVRLYFPGNVKAVQASSASGVSVSTQGGGAFVLSGTRSLPSGEAAVVSLRFTRTGTGEQPGECTVNGANCVID